MLDRSEEIFQICVDNPLPSTPNFLPHLAQRIVCRSPSPISEVGFIKYRLKDRFQPIEQRLLTQTIIDRGDGEFIMHLSKLNVGMLGTKMTRISNPFVKFLLLGAIERDPPRTTTVKLARLDDIPVDPVVDDMCAHPEALCSLLHSEFFRPLERD